MLPPKVFGSKPPRVTNSVGASPYDAFLWLYVAPSPSGQWNCSSKIIQAARILARTPIVVKGKRRKDLLGPRLEAQGKAFAFLKRGARRRKEYEE